MIYNRKLTFSLCPACFAIVPAIIESTPQGVFMTKTCRTHGDFQSVVERDPNWYDFCQTVDTANPHIYNGYFIDVTDKCNLKCQYCYHPKGDNHRSVADIVADASQNRHLAPFLLTGGEPTEHPELPDIIKKLSAIGETWILSNGVNLLDDLYFKELLDSGLKGQHCLQIGLSVHPDADGAAEKVLDKCAEMGEKIGSVQFTIDSLDQIDEAVQFFIRNQGAMILAKIKAVSNLWAEQRVGNHLYTSDMINYLRTKYPVEAIPGLAQKVSYASVQVNHAMAFNLVSWYTPENVDLVDIDCPPYYRCHDGAIRDFLTACLFNWWMEGEREGVRVRRAVNRDVTEMGKLWEALVREENPTYTPNRAEWVKQELALMQDPKHYILVAEKEGKLIGIQSGDVALEPSIDRRCVIGRHFYVSPDHRKGPAAKMLNDLTLDLGSREQVTDILRPINPRLLDFWKKQGCEVMDIIVRTGYVGR